MITTDTTLTEVRIGRVGPLGAKQIPSGIHKLACDHPVQININGLAGDEQGDRRHHGGPEKAVHQYPLGHYSQWSAELPERSDVLTAGGFGENFVASGWTERDVCVGDIVAAGSALLQVSQARQPCFRLNLRFDVPDMARRTQLTLRTGWYYRVIDEGAVRSGDSLRVVHRVNPDWPLSRLLHVFYVDCLDAAALEEIANMETLSASWRRVARTRLEKRAIEDWSSRLE